MTTLTTTDEIQNRIQQATDYLKKQVSASPDFALILGTGLGELADKAENATVVPYKDIPGFPVSTAPGHKGNLVFGRLGGKNVVLMQGRFHTYEGYSQAECTIPVAVSERIGLPFSSRRMLVHPASSRTENNNSRLLIQR